jgi:hypothetical protein
MIGCYLNTFLCDQPSEAVAIFSHDTTKYRKGNIHQAVDSQYQVPQIRRLRSQCLRRKQRRPGFFLLVMVGRDNLSLLFGLITLRTRIGQFAISDCFEALYDLLEKQLIMFNL